MHPRLGWFREDEPEAGQPRCPSLRPREVGVGLTHCLFPCQLLGEGTVVSPAGTGPAPAVQRSWVFWKKEAKLAHLPRLVPSSLQARYPCCTWLHRRQDLPLIHLETITGSLHTYLESLQQPHFTDQRWEVTCPRSQSIPRSGTRIPLQVCLNPRPSSFPLYRPHGPFCLCNTVLEA